MNTYYTCKFCKQGVEANYAIHHGCDCEQAVAKRKEEKNTDILETIDEFIEDV